MRRGTVIICEPVPAWLFDDGIRLMPKDTPEWIGLHQTFIDLVRSSNIGFNILLQHLATLIHVSNLCWTNGE